MGKLLKTEKLRYTEFRERLASLPHVARQPGMYKRFSRLFCWPREFASENLCPEFRPAALDFFATRNIKWHEGQAGLPSNHLCDSQVCCVNFLFPFSQDAVALRELLRPLFPTIQEVLPFDDGAFLTFEWIGERDYLGEKADARNKKRSRGANCTSADAATLFVHEDGRRQMVLIEWKYCEAYYATPLHTGPSGSRRKMIYFPWLQAPDSPLVQLPDYTVLFYEPFYQFMRQQLLANQMEKAHELGAEIVSLLHVAPLQNVDFRRVTSPALRTPDATATSVWSTLLRMPDRFRSISTQELFSAFPAQKFGLEAWWAYQVDRYSWINALVRES